MKCVFCPCVYLALLWEAIRVILDRNVWARACLYSYSFFSPLLPHLLPLTERMCLGDGWHTWIRACVHLHLLPESLRSFFEERCLRLNFFALIQMFFNSTSICLHRDVCKVWPRTPQIHLSAFIHTFTAFSSCELEQEGSKPYMWKWFQISTLLCM